MAGLEWSIFWAQPPPLWISQNDGGFDLSLRDGPVAPEQELLLFGTDHTESVPFVKVNRPDCVRPSSDEHWFVGHLAQVRKQCRAESTFLAGGPCICMANQGDVLYVL